MELQNYQVIEEKSLQNNLTILLNVSDPNIINVMKESENNSNRGFIAAFIFGSCLCIFEDFGKNFRIYDSDGEPPFLYLI